MEFNKFNEGEMKTIKGRMKRFLYKVLAAFLVAGIIVRMYKKGTLPSKAMNIGLVIELLFYSVLIGLCAWIFVKTLQL